MKRIVYTDSQGRVCVATPAGLESDAIERAIGRVPVGAVNVRVIEHDEIPSDRTFRNAWKQNGSDIEHDMSQCRCIHRDKMRQVRKPKLLALDILFIRALENGDIAERDRIIAEKHVLRDVTDATEIEAAQTTEQLKAVWPDCLK